MFYATKSLKITKINLLEFGKFVNATYKAWVYVSVNAIYGQYKLAFM